MLKDRNCWCNSDGTANFVAKCKNCDRKSSIRIDPKSPYCVKPNEDGMIKGVVAVFECRGIDIEKLELGNSMTVKVAGSPTTFENADFT